MKSLKFNLELKGGKYDFNRQEFTQYMSKLPDGKYLMEIKKYYKQRSKQQNRYYWAVIDTIGEELGYERTEMHETFKLTFLGAWKDTGLLIPKSTTKLTTIEFKDYMDTIIRFAAERGIVIPDPDTFTD